jgi:hypothetical protein
MGHFLFCNSLEDLLKDAIHFDAERCSNEGVGSTQSSVEVY